MQASTSDPPAGADGGGEAAPAASEPPPPSASSSSKRRWSPSTWRYAIEEVQPELGSRARSNPLSTSAPPPRATSEHMAPLASSKSRLHPHDHLYGDDQPRRAPPHSNRTWGGVEHTELRVKHGRSHEMLSRKKRPLNSHQLHHLLPKQVAKKQHSPKEEEEDDEVEVEVEVEVEEEEDCNDAELGHHFEEGRKREKREMSPSELYYCEICRAKAEASKSNPTESLPSVS